MLIFGAMLPLLASCASQSTRPSPPISMQTEEQKEAMTRQERLAISDKFKEEMSSQDANKKCIEEIRENLLDPTSFSITSNFVPDPLWLSSVASDLDEKNTIVFSSKMLARNRSGNIAPARAMCYYYISGNNLTYKSGFAFNH